MKAIEPKQRGAQWRYVGIVRLPLMRRFFFRGLGSFVGNYLICIDNENRIPLESTRDNCNCGFAKRDFRYMFESPSPFKKNS
ncbi:hypothetical protein KIN20_036518 [Parelaphostrongylus tenuis]|uniref:Uncharacterized protein n=1 Tax=Parelaphostrongylus tenuis TaxID=148309 RepID=A0AAD5WL95_PARTN|nr:hypothetical protein KIN20_036518 [Parelaphostrongylus tenuis]